VALASTFFVLASSLLVGCSSRTITSSSPVLRSSTDRALPLGWTRFSYGSLSIGVPSGWTVDKSPFSICVPQPNDTVQAVTFTTQVSSACPSGTETALQNDAQLECLTATANHLYVDASSTTVINGTVLGRLGAGSGLGLYL
jgi:hypothetical protein